MYFSHGQADGLDGLVPSSALLQFAVERAGTSISAINRYKTSDETTCARVGCGDPQGPARSAEQGGTDQELSVPERNEIPQ
jgi:hypothetical protein